jgi:hypothetical protein
MTRGLPALTALALLFGCGSEPAASFGDEPAPGSTASTNGPSGSAGGSTAQTETGGAPIVGAGNAPDSSGGAAVGVAVPGSGGAAAPGSPSGGAAGTLVGPGVLTPAVPGTPPVGALADIVFEMASTVPPGGETLMCAWQQMPADRGVIAVPSAESQFTAGSHHLLAYRSDLTMLPDGQTAGAAWACSDGSWMTHMRGSYYEAQQPESRRDLPPGVAHRFQPGEVVIMQTHYLNSGSDQLAAHAKLTLHTVEVATVPQEAGSIIWSDVNINVAAGAKGRVTLTCPVPSDIHPALLWSHMHKQGSNFVATTDDQTAAAALGGNLYAENDWDEPHPRAYPYDPPITLHSGTHVTFSCDFTNPNSYALTFGQSAEMNEMCILHGMYWPRMTSSSAEQCFGGMSTRSSL